MTGAVDLDGPLQEFYQRTTHIRQILSAAESLARGNTIQTNRQRADFDKKGPRTSITANSMALIFLASSFEEFFREEITAISDLFMTSYIRVPLEHKLVARNSYWSISIERVRRVNSVLATIKKKRVLDVDAVSRAKTLLDRTVRFSLSDDPSEIDSQIFSDHQHNFRPNVVNEIAGRLGITDIISQSADTIHIRNYFGTTKKADASAKLIAKLTEFYGIRNTLVHSLSNSQGYGVDFVFDFIELFENFATALNARFHAHISGW